MNVVTGRLLAVAVVLISIAWAPRAPAATPAATTHAVGEYRFHVAPVPEFVAATDLPAAWPADAPGASEASWRVWRFERQIDRRGPRVRRYLDYAYEARSAELLGEAAKLQLEFNPAFEELTLHAVEVRRDGRWSSRLVPGKVTLARRESEFENDMSNGVVTALLVLDDIRAGDVIRVRQSVDGDNPILGGQARESLAFGWTAPLLQARLRVLFPPGADVAEVRDPGSPEGRRQARADALELDFAQERLAAFVDEQIYPRGYRWMPLVELAERRDWADVVQWALPLYPAPAPLPASLQARIAEWKVLGGDQAIAAALRAVQEEVRYFGVEIGDSTHRPAEPAVTWERRYGDCKDKVRLLVAILAELGVPARPALVSAREGRAVAGRTPSAAAFDHVIAQVLPADGATLWLDPTMTQQRGSPRAMAVGDFGVALPVAPGVTALADVKRPAGAKDRTRVVEHLHAGDERGFTLTVESEYRGDAADRQRRAMQSQGRDVMARHYTEYYRRRFGDVEPIDALDVEEHESDNTLVVREAYRVPRPWAESAGGQHAFDPFPSVIAEYVALPSVLERKAPLPVAHPVDVEHVTRVDLPAGWQWVEPPTERTLRDDAIRFALLPRLKQGQAELVQRFASRRDVVGTDALAAHLQVRRSIGDALNTRLLLSAPKAAAARERQQRLNSLMQGLMNDKTDKGSARGDD